MMMTKRYIVKAIEVNGQICVPIPKEICDELGIKEGTKLSVEESPDGKSILMRKVG